MTVDASRIASSSEWLKQFYHSHPHMVAVKIDAIKPHNVPGDHVSAVVIPGLRHYRFASVTAAEEFASAHDSHVVTNKEDAP